MVSLISQHSSHLIHSKPAVSQRIIAVDLCRGLAVILMVLVHAHDMYGNEASHHLGNVFGAIPFAC